MLLLVAGVLLWSATHLMVSVAPDVRAGLIAKMGLNPYKGLFSLTLVAALIMIVIGWKSSPVTAAWLPPIGMRHLTMLLVPIAVILFISARAPTDIRQLIRHPQLTGVKLWAVAHLLSNGEWRSLILFGGLLAWAVLEVIFINRRQGERIKPPKAGATKTMLTVVAGIAIAAVLMMAHPWLAGVPVIPQ